MHALCEAHPDPMLLMEVMPSLLVRREFPPPPTTAALEPGYRDSPRPSALALVFVRVRACDALGALTRA